MFRKAFSIARKFTLPVILSRRTVEGKCEASMSSCVVINDEGWIVTAGHVLAQLHALIGDKKNTEAMMAQLDGAKNAPNRNERRRLEKTLPRPRKDATTNWSMFFANLPIGVAIDEGAVAFQSADLGIARLKNFDPTWVKQYPVFKKAEDLEPGVSLCKLGFPFHEIQPTWDDANNVFRLDNLVLTYFPIDGIFTRHLLVEQPPDVEPLPFPVKFIETSTPGLRGQSGGPTFDTDGTVWAIQAQTSHLPLGFSPRVPGGKDDEKEHQFLNVGLGVHPETLLGAFNHLQIKHQVSTT